MGATYPQYKLHQISRWTLDFLYFIVAEIERQRARDLHDMVMASWSDPKELSTKLLDLINGRQSHDEIVDDNLPASILSPQYGLAGDALPAGSIEQEMLHLRQQDEELQRIRTEEGHDAYVAEIRRIMAENRATRNA